MPTKLARLYTNESVPVHVVTTASQVVDFEAGTKRRLKEIAMQAAAQHDDAVVTGISYVPASTSYYYRPSLFSVGKTSVSIPKGIRVLVDNILYTSESVTDVLLDTFVSADDRKGRDVYLYAVENKGQSIPKFVLSLNSTWPAGYNSYTSRKIGGFHCLCENAGRFTSAYPNDLSGYAAGDILPASVWDLEHRPYSSPEGMVYIEGLNIWVDIYLNSISAGELYSVHGGTILTGVTGTQMTWYNASRYLAKTGKRLPTLSEFIYFSAGSNTGTVIEGKEIPVTAGGHKDTNGRRMISSFGIEDCCGALYQWSSEAGGIFSDEDVWEDNGIVKTFNNPSGYSYKRPARALLGGCATISDPVRCGSSCNTWSYFPESILGFAGVRGVSRNIGK